MKTTLILVSLILVNLTSCYVTPRRSPLSPGGRFITPMERNNHSPLSPGGRAVTPLERNNHSRLSPGGRRVTPAERIFR